MANDTLEQVMDRWMSDESFRAEMRADPEAAVQKRGIALSGEDRAALQNIDWDQPDEQLQQRVSKVIKKP